MAAVLLDTTVVIDLLRGRRGATARLRSLRESGDVAYVCAINIDETVRGLRSGEDTGARQLFAGLRTIVLGEREGWQAGEWRRRFAAGGQSLSQADCLVAAAAVSFGARLATGNPRDFPMGELKLEHWPAGD